MAIVHINPASDTIGSQVTKINDTQDLIPVSGSYNSGTLTLTLFGGGNFTVNGIGGSSGGVFKIGSGSGSIIPTGYTNTDNTGNNSTLAGGSSNSITGSSSFIGAGGFNQALGLTSFIGAGTFNIVRAQSSGIVAGVQNDILAGTGYGNVILAGTRNNINANAKNSSVISGTGNTIDTNIENSSILAGNGLTNSLSNVAMSAGFAIPSGTSQGRLFIQRGTNSISGKDTLGGGGTKTVNTTRATTDCIVMLTPQSTLAGTLYVSALNDGTSFTVSSTNAADTCSFGWLLIHDIVA